MINSVKRTCNTMDPDIMIDMPYISKTDCLKICLEPHIFKV